MPEEVSSVTTEAVKKISDGTVQIAVEKYNEMLETIATQKGSLSGVRDQLDRVLNQPPVVNRTVIKKTAEMLATENRVWGTTFMGLGAASFAVGVYRYRAGKS